MIRSIFLVAALLMAGTASAQVARDTVVGVDRASMVWAGPDDIYPRVGHVRPGDRVWLHGCLRMHAWCDVSMVNGSYRSRGWVPGHVLFIPWQGQRHSLSSNGLWQQFPVGDFVLSVYWGSHYSQLPWYHQRNRFERHDWRRDQWQWGRNDRRSERDDWRARNDREDYRQQVINDRREAERRKASGRDSEGLTPLQRQIKSQSQRARELQRQRQEPALPRVSVPFRQATPARSQAATPATTSRTPLQRRIEESAKQRKQIQP